MKLKLVLTSAEQHKLVMMSCRVMQALTEEERNEEFKLMAKEEGECSEAFKKKYKELAAQYPDDFTI